MSFFTRESLDNIRTVYATIERCPLYLARRLMRRTRALNDDAVRELAGAQIRFISRIARNEVCRRGLAGTQYAG